MTNIGDLTGSLDEQNNQRKIDQDKQRQLDTVTQAGDKVVKAVQDSSKTIQPIQGDVKVTNSDLAKSQDVNQAVEAINKLNLTTFMQNEGLPKLAQNLADLSDKTQNLQEKMESEGLKKMSDQLAQVVKKLDEVSKVISKTEVSVDAKLQKTIDNLSKSIDKIDFSPQVNISAPDTKVVTTPIDLSSVVKALDKVEKAINAQETPDTEVDIAPMVSGIESVRQSIEALRFPVPNYVLPFMTSTGKATQVKLGDDGSLPITASISTGGLATSVKQSDGSQKTQVVDGSGNVIGATSNALDVNIKSGSSAGTQYTDGASTATHPIGTIPVYDKSGTITAVSVSNPLPVSASVTPVSDVSPATQNITAQDIATSTVAGYNGQTFIIGTPTANSSATFTLSSITTVNIQTTGIWTGSLRIEASTDGGTVYVSKFSRLPGTVYAGAATVTSNAFLIAAVSGCTHIRIRSIAAWTGTATIKITESINDHLTDVLNPIRLLDSTTNTLMTIKPASTAPLATDTAMVVALSPNTNLASGQPVINGEQTDFTGTFTNATQTGTVVATNLDGYGNVLISINGTYGTATAIFEGSDDGGTTWYTVQASRDNTNVIETGYTSLTNTSQTWQINNPGFDSIRVRSTAVASGTVNVRMSASAAPGAAGANVAIGSALPTGSNTIGAVNVTDGTNNLNVLKSDGTAVGQNAALVAPAVLTIPFTTSASGVQTILANTDVSHYASIEIVYTSVGVGLSLTGQWSTASGGTYVNTNTFFSNNGTATSLGNSVNTIYFSGIYGNFFQLAVSALTSGTFAGTITLRAAPRSTTGVNATQQGAWSFGSNSATGSAVPANAFYGAMRNTSGNLQGLTTAGFGDGGSNEEKLATTPFISNGTTLDKARSVTNATNSTGTGIAATGALAQFDDVSPTAITENQFGNLRMSANRNLYGTIRDAAGNERGANVSAGNALLVDASATTQPVSGNLTNISGTISLPTGAATSANQSTEITSLGTIAALSKAEDAASASGDTGVVPLGVRNDALTAAQTGTNGDYGALSLDTSGILITAGAPRALKGRQATTITSSTSETTIVTAVASTFLDVYGLILTNTSATVTKVSIRDATAGGTVSVFEVPATETRGFMLPVDSAVPQATVNNNWTAQAGTSVASLEISVLYVKRV